MNRLIPERLTIARETMGITKAEAARRCGLTKIGYCRYEYGDRSPSPQIVEILALRLNTSTDYLTGGSDDRDPAVFVVDREKTPYLYELSLGCANAGEEMTKRVLAYYKKLKQRYPGL